MSDDTPSKKRKREAAAANVHRVVEDYKRLSAQVKHLTSKLAEQGSEAQLLRDDLDKATETNKRLQKEKARLQKKLDDARAVWTLLINKNDLSEVSVRSLQGHDFAFHEYATACRQMTEAKSASPVQVYLFSPTNVESKDDEYPQSDYDMEFFDTHSGDNLPKCECEACKQAEQDRVKAIEQALAMPIIRDNNEDEDVEMQLPPVRFLDAKNSKRITDFFHVDENGNENEED